MKVELSPVHPQCIPSAIPSASPVQGVVPSEEASKFYFAPAFSSWIEYFLSN